ncbi:peptide deformylase [Immundisolibacter sp.]|uniref:peptide deformylase n=1 Tax=Immundisolibacter sp. TaxID=1934948 RepID=UPI0026378CF2|nr:peptide deformylase [Immundisolibacter sp.]MDD3651337.1 peptide deformylase [Immundisolibacter sp.]
MAVRQVLRMGHPLLMQAAQAVPDPRDPALATLLEDLFDTMAACHGAGLAAPQIGVPARVVVFGVTHNPRYPQAEAVPRTVLINPVIEVLDPTEEDGWEGCLSVPGLRGRVPRPRMVRYRGYDERGHLIEREAGGFHARVVQHECDHLDGVLYPQRMRDLRWFGFEPEILHAMGGA